MSACGEHVFVEGAIAHAAAQGRANSARYAVQPAHQRSCARGSARLVYQLLSQRPAAGRGLSRHLGWLVRDFVRVDVVDF